MPTSYRMCDQSVLCQREKSGEGEVNISLFWTHSAVIWFEALGLCCKCCLEKSDNIFSTKWVIKPLKLTWRDESRIFVLKCLIPFFFFFFSCPQIECKLESFMDWNLRFLLCVSFSVHWDIYFYFPSLLGHISIWTMGWCLYSKINLSLRLNSLYSIFRLHMILCWPADQESTLVTLKANRIFRRMDFGFKPAKIIYL